MVHGTGNPYLTAWVQATGLSHGELARRIAAEALRRGHRQVAPDATRLRRWMDGERPRPPVPEILAAVLSDALGQILTPGDLGLLPTGVPLDTIALPLLTEPAAAALAAWTRMDLLMLDRREALKLAVGAPLIAATSHMLGGTARALGGGRSGFDADSVSALEEMTAVFTALDASHGGGLYRPAIVAQLAEVARRIQDGIPPSLRTRVFAATADLAALAGWTSHDSGRYATAQRYWSYGIYAAGEAGSRGRGVEIVTRMSHQMIYLGNLDDALGLLQVAGQRAETGGEPRVRALVLSQTGRVHAALGQPEQAEAHLERADAVLAEATGPAPAWVAYFDAAEHAGARAVSARDLHHHGHRGQRASTHFEQALALRGPGFERVTAMDRVGLAAALFDEGEPERAAAAGQQALNGAGLQSALIASRINTLMAAAARYRTPEVDELRARATDIVSRAPQTAPVAA